jgi:hypothetical protein
MKNIKKTSILKSYFIIAALVLFTSSVSAKTIIVQSQGKRIVLTSEQVHYLLSSHNTLIISALKSGMQTIRFNEAADEIISLLNSRNVK